MSVRTNYINNFHLSFNLMMIKNPIRFAQSWEDYQVIECGLQIKKNDTIVTIISSGDNLLNLLRFEPADIYGYDINPAQIYEVKLKIAAIEHLTYTEFLTFFGYTGTEQQRIKLFHILTDHLDIDTYTFWNQHMNLLSQGLAFQGWLERYFSFFRYFIRFFLAEEYNHYVTAQTKKERQVIFEKKINRPFLKAFTKIFMNNRVMTHLLFQKRVIQYIPSSFNYHDSFWRNITHAFVDIGCVNNPYLYWLFTGIVLEDRHYWQPYLQEKNYAMLRQQIKKIHIFEQDLCAGLKELKSDSIDAFYISDIFDWMSLEEMEKTLLEIVRVGKNDARIISFILNYDKGIPQRLRNLVYINEKKSLELSAQERVGIYSKINLLEVKK
jgi:S-adenosylmethionine-diacylglycerol 3-amino-3-carboxypropyl transferase